MSSSSKRGRGRPPIAKTIVEKLEQSGDTPIADKVRTVAGLPPRPLTRDEDFIAAVRAQVTIRPVGFHAADPIEAEHWAQLARELPAPGPNEHYVVRVFGAHIVVKLAGRNE